MDTLLPAFGQPAIAPRRRLLAFLASSHHWVHRWVGPRLQVDATTTAENESSVVLHAEFDGRGVVLTGRAGIGALDAAASYAEQLGIDLPASLCLIQAPNGGSADHLSPKVLDRIVGRCKPGTGRTYTKSAFISVSLEAGQDPSPIVTEALKRRGALSFVTLGTSLHHLYEMPDRGWYRAQPSNMKT